MAKKKKSEDNLLKFVIAISAIAASAMIFAPSLASENQVFNGTDISFGTEFSNFYGLASGSFEFNILATLAYLLPLVAVFVLFIVKSKLAPAIALLILVSSVILQFTMQSSVDIALKILNTTTYIEVEWAKAWGLILTMALTISAALFTAYESYKEFK